MSFAADWLAARAPADARARDRGLEDRLARHLGGRESLTVLDLGAGTGNNLRHLSPRLPGHQHWLLAENDPVLVAALSQPDAGGHLAEPVQADLATDLPALMARGPDLVTCSALLDLAGRDWLRLLADAVTAARVPLLAVLTYDGTEAWAPPHPLDAEVLAAFHRDQRRDKGLGGPALGPEAAETFADMLDGGATDLHIARSDWVLHPPADARLIAMLAEGSAAAVGPEIGAEAAAEWQAARRTATSVLVGHVDLLVLPRG